MTPEGTGEVNYEHCRGRRTRRKKVSWTIVYMYDKGINTTIIIIYRER